MKCKRCGREFTGNFCPQCGVPAKETKRPVQRNRCAGRFAEKQCLPKINVSFANVQRVPSNRSSGVMSSSLHSRTIFS